jgi:integrase/recombinase XerD
MRLQFLGLLILERRLCRKTGGQHSGQYCLRRSYVIFVFSKGVDNFTFSRLLGHCNIKITKCYLNIGEEDLRLAHLRASPADSLE